MTPLPFKQSPGRGHRVLENIGLNNGGSASGSKGRGASEPKRVVRGRHPRMRGAVPPSACHAVMARPAKLSGASTLHRVRVWKGGGREGEGGRGGGLQEG